MDYISESMAWLTDAPVSYSKLVSNSSSNRMSRSFWCKISSKLLKIDVGNSQKIQRMSVSTIWEQIDSILPAFPKCPKIGSRWMKAIWGWGCRMASSSFWRVVVKLLPSSHRSYIMLLLYSWKHIAPIADWLKLYSEATSALVGIRLECGRLIFSDSSRNMTRCHLSAALFNIFLNILPMSFERNLRHFHLVTLHWPLCHTVT